MQIFTTKMVITNKSGISHSRSPLGDFFTSRKTLLNEFNHFEGNMNIFQPAIDITDIALNEEKESILDYLEKLRKNKEHMIETELEEDLV